MNRAPLVIAACLIAANVFLHTQVSGWGTINPSPSSTLMPCGIAYNNQDNLSYCAWAQQAKQGLWLFGDLYTTSPHKPLLLNPFFLLVGRLAAVFQTSPILTLNLVMLLCIPVFLASLVRICKILGFGGTTTFLVLCLALGGGGASWIRWALSEMHVGGILHIGSTGPDLFYYDLYPATALCVYPYHTVSLTMLAVVAMLLVSYETAARVSLWQWLLLVAAAAILASTRPYEPPLLFAAYLLLVLVSHVARVPTETRRRRRNLLLALGIGLLPFSGYAFWVALQPVWVIFASFSFNVLGTMDWTAGFLVLWVLAVAGFVIGGAGCLASPRAFLFIWSLPYAVLLIVFSSGLTKSCGGLTIPLSMVAGVALERAFAQQGQGWRRRLTVAVLAFCAIASPLLGFSRCVRETELFSADLLRAAAVIRADTNTPVPTVLTDLKSSSLLPGLAGFRVFCGHWALTDEPLEKGSLLMLLGFSMQAGDPAVSIDAETIRRQARNLSEQFDRSVFDYLLVRKDHKLARELIFKEDRPIYDGFEYLAFRVSPTIRAQLLNRLRVIESRAGILGATSRGPSP